MTPQQVAKTLNGDCSGNRVTAPGPGHSKHDRSLSITLKNSAPDGFLVHSFAGDDWQDCRDYVKDRLGISSGDYKPSSVTRTAPDKGADDAKREAMALALWAETKPLQGTLAEKYLSGRHCLLGSMSADIRFHPSTWFKVEGQSVPAMICLIRDIKTNQPCGIHRTFLNGNGAKVGRMMLGRAKGGCVKLSPDDAVTTGLGIAEGVETSLSVMKHGFTPVWACLSAGAIRDFPVLSGFEAITVFADSDETGTRAAQQCCIRWREAGREVCPLSHCFGDYNDRGVL